MRAIIATLALLATPAHADEVVHAMLSRPVTVTCKLDASIAFYRDVLNQSVLDDSVRDGARVSQYVDMPASAKTRLVIMGPMDVILDNDAGTGRFGFIGVDDPKAGACKDATTTKRARTGDVLFSVRVVNLDEVAKRAKKRGDVVVIPPGTSGSGKARNMMLQDPNGRIVEAFEVLEQK